VSVEYVLFVLRIVFIFALYFFIIMIARVLSREIAAPAETTAAAGEQRAAGRGAVMPGYAFVVVVDGADTGLAPGTSIRIASGMLIGRAPGCDVQLPDAYTSSEHARMREERGHWVLEDLRSMNGSYVNGQRINGTRQLADGDTVQLGRVVLQFVLRAPA
jgi:hypothetical protein